MEALLHVLLMRNWFIRNEYEASQKIKKLYKYVIQEKLRNYIKSICLKQSTLPCCHSLMLTIFVWKILYLVIVICLDICREVKWLYPRRSVRLSNNVSFGFENKKLIKKLLVLGILKF